MLARHARESLARSHSRVAAVAAAALAVAVAAGCSGSHSSPKSFAHDYKQVSANYREDMLALQTQAREASQRGAAAELKVFRQMLATTTATLHKMRDLHPRSALQRTYDQLVRALDRQTDALQQALRAVDHNDHASLNDALVDYARALQDGLSLQQQLDASVGLARPPTPSG